MYIYIYIYIVTIIHVNVQIICTRYQSLNSDEYLQIISSHSAGAVQSTDFIFANG